MLPGGGAGREQLRKVVKRHKLPVINTRGVQHDDFSYLTLQCGKYLSC